MQPDDIDWKIINLLRDSHQNNNAIARQLGISEGTVRQRLKKLKQLKKDLLSHRRQA